MTEISPQMVRRFVIKTDQNFGGCGGSLRTMAACAVNPYRRDGNGIRFVDVTDPDNIGDVVDVPFATDGSQGSSMYAQFQDFYAFSGGSKVDMHNIPAEERMVGIFDKRVAHVDGIVLVDDGSTLDTRNISCLSAIC